MLLPSLAGLGKVLQAGDDDQPLPATLTHHRRKRR
jgi:hypothetical protein